MLAFSFWDAFWLIFIAFLWINLLMVFFSVIFDLFRDKELSGWGKAGWVCLLLFLPLLGLLIYLIARGQSMADRSMKDQADAQAGFDSYVRDVAGGGAASELEKASALHAAGSLSDDEYAALKSKILGS